MHGLKMAGGTPRIWSYRIQLFTSMLSTSFDAEMSADSLCAQTIFLSERRDSESLYLSVQKRQLRVSPCVVVRVPWAGWPKRCHGYEGSKTIKKKQRRRDLRM